MLSLYGSAWRRWRGGEGQGRAGQDEVWAVTRALGRQKDRVGQGPHLQAVLACKAGHMHQGQLGQKGGFPTFESNTKDMRSPPPPIAPAAAFQRRPRGRGLGEST